MELKSKNLVRIIYEFAPGGGGSVTHTIELSRHMAPCLNRQFVITPKADEDTTELDNSFPFEVHRVSTCRFRRIAKVKNKLLPALPITPLIHISFVLSALLKVIELDSRFGIDIVQAHGVGAGPTATISNWLTKKPSIWMLHGTCLAYSRISGAYETFVTRTFKPKHMFVLDDGSPAAARFRQIMNKRVTVVQHAIDTKRYRPLSKPEIMVEKLNLSEDFFTVLSPHSLVPVKGLDYAIKSFEQLLKSLKEERAVLVVAGDGPSENYLKSYTRELGLCDYVKFIGRIKGSKMPEYYALSDIVLATSLYSNKNRTTQEAMACTKPVVAFDSGGTRDVIVDGQTGLLAEPENCHSLSWQIERLYKNPGLRQDLGQQARAFIRQTRSWETRIERELAVYKQLIRQ